MPTSTADPASERSHRYHHHPWLEFWNRPHRIYVNDRHLHAHYRRIVDDLVPLLPERKIDLLDWGCGNALGAPALSALGIRVTLFDGARAVQQELAERFAGRDDIRVLDRAAYEQLPAASFDVVFINSVIQYLSESDFSKLLIELRRVLRPSGRILLGDVLDPDSGVLDDVRALLASGWKHGYFLAANLGLAATFFSDYRRLRQKHALTAYRPERLVELLARHGFDAVKLPRNIGFSHHRQTFELKPVRDSST